MSNTLLILSKDASFYKAQLENAQLANLSIHAFNAVAEAKQSSYTRNCNLLLAQPDLAVSILAHMPRLEWLQSTWAGVTPLLANNVPRNFLLTGVKGIFGSLMSEYVFAYILVFERHILEHVEAQKVKEWHPLKPTPLTGKTMGILGTGSIGSHVAGTAKHFGLKTKGFSMSGTPKPHFDSVMNGNILEFLPDIDYLVNTLPDTPETRQLLTEHVFSTMKESSLFINIARGTIVDEAVLAKALNAQQIRGAALDVFQLEPLPASSPLWTSPNTFITSHTSGPSFPGAVADIFIRNYQHFIADEELDYVIDYEKGY